MHLRFTIVRSPDIHLYVYDNDVDYYNKDNDDDDNNHGDDDDD